LLPCVGPGLETLAEHVAGLGERDGAGFGVGLGLERGEALATGLADGAGEADGEGLDEPDPGGDGEAEGEPEGAGEGCSCIVACVRAFGAHAVRTSPVASVSATMRGITRAARPCPPPTAGAPFPRDQSRLAQPSEALRGIQDPGRRPANGSGE
jgi:hypothetical protein